MKNLQAQIDAAANAGPHAQAIAAEKVSKSFAAALQPMAQNLAAEQGVNLGPSSGRGK